MLGRRGFGGGNIGASLGVGGFGGGAAPTGVSYAGSSGEGGRLAKLKAPGEEGAFPFLGGGYAPGSAPGVTYPSELPQHNFRFAQPSFGFGGGSFAPPAPPTPPNGAGVGGIGNLLSLANTARKLPEYADKIKNLFNPDAANIASGFGNLSAADIGVNTAQATGQAGGSGVPFSALNPTPAVPQFSPMNPGGEGMGGGFTTSNPYGFAIPAAMLAFAKWSDSNEAKKRMEAAQRYGNAASAYGSERDQYSDGLTGFMGNNGNYYLEQNNGEANTAGSDFHLSRYLDTALQASPTSDVQYTGEYSQPMLGAGRNAVELKNVGDSASMQEYLRNVIAPTYDVAQSAPRFGANDQGQEDQSRWLARELPSILGGGQRYALNMKDGSRLDLADGQVAPAGYELASNNGYGSDAPALPTRGSMAEALANNRTRSTPSIGGSQAGSRNVSGAPSGGGGSSRAAGFSQPTPKVKPITPTAAKKPAKPTGGSRFVPKPNQGIFSEADLGR